MILAGVVLLFQCLIDNRIFSPISASGSNVNPQTKYVMYLCG